MSVFIISILFITIIVMFKQKHRIQLSIIEYLDIVSWENSQNLKVFIPENHKNSELTKQCFEEWSTVTERNISFDYVKEEKDANIILRFQNEFNKEQVEWYDLYIGLTYSSVYSHNPTKISKMEIIIVDKDNISAYLKQDELHSVILHEIGHSIGLLRHSNDKTSVMYKHYIKGQEITQSDIDRLKKMYKF